MERGAWGAVLGALLALWVAAPAGAATIEAAGPEQVVFDYDTMRCHDGDSSDGPARAFRDASNRVQVWMPGTNTRMLGPTLENALTHDCRVVLTSHVQADPAAYDDADWLGGGYTDDGQTIHALVHSEYHGARHPGYCPGEPFLKCRFNTVTYARSTDAGETYDHPSGPQNLVASIPYRYVPGDGRYGYFAPSNIIKRGDFYYAVMIASALYAEQRPGTCLIRTRTLGDPKSWRAWDGEGFNVRFVDPYRESPEPIGRHVCEPVSYPQIRDIDRSLHYNTALDKYVITGTSNKYDPALGRAVFGFYFSTSDDLIHWTERQLIMETATIGTYMCGDPNPRAYPAILDPDSTDRNFATADQTAYLYYTELIYVNCILTRARDLMRVPIQISP